MSAGRGYFAASAPPLRFSGDLDSHAQFTDDFVVLYQRSIIAPRKYYRPRPHYRYTVEDVVTTVPFGTGSLHILIANVFRAYFITVDISLVSEHGSVNQ